MAISREDIDLEGDAYDWQCEVAHRFDRAVMDMAFTQAVEDDCRLITLDRMKAAARCVAESRPTYLEDE